MGRIKEGYIVRFTFPWGETSLATLKVINVYRGEVIIRHLGTMNTVSVKVRFIFDICKYNNQIK